jgi:hypothetical protein
MLLCVKGRQEFHNPRDHLFTYFVDGLKKEVEERQTDL